MDFTLTRQVNRLIDNNFGKLNLGLTVVDECEKPERKI